MTVNYNLCVSTSSPLSLFKLLLRWKGSIWKAVWIEYLFYLFAFNMVSISYRYILTDSYQTWVYREELTPNRSEQGAFLGGNPFLKPFQCNISNLLYRVCQRVYAGCTEKAPSWSVALENAPYWPESGAQPVFLSLTLFRRLYRILHFSGKPPPW